MVAKPVIQLSRGSDSRKLGDQAEAAIELPRPSTQGPAGARPTPATRPGSVLAKLLPPLALLLTLLLIGAAWLPIELHRRYLEQALGNLASDAQYELDLGLQEQAEGLMIAAEVLAANNKLRQALGDLDRAALLQHWGPLFQELKQRHEVTHFYLHGPDRRCLLRLHQPERHSDRIDRHTARAAEREDRPAAGIELGPLGSFTLRVVVPVRVDGRRIGYVELGKEIEDILTTVRGHLDIQMAVLIDKARLNRAAWQEGMRMLGREANWDLLPDQVLSFASNREAVIASALAKNPAPGAGDQVAPEGIRFRDANGDSWWTIRLPLRDVAGDAVGHLLLVRDIGAEQKHFHRLLGASLTLAAALLLLLLALVTVLLRRVDRQLLAQQQALRDSDQLLRNLARQVPGFLYQIERQPTGHLAMPFASDGIRETLELAPEDVREDAAPALARVHPEDLPLLLESINTSARELTLWQEDFRVLIPERDPRWLRGLSRPERLPDAGVRWHGYIADITERKAEEQHLVATNRRLAEATARAEAANRAKSQFLANLSHEIRTPLNSVLGVLQLLREAEAHPATSPEASPEANKDRQDLLDIGLESGRALLQLINDILDFSKIEAGKLELSPVTFAPRDLLAAIHAIFRVQAKGKGIDIEQQVASEVPGLVRADAARLRQILLNLIGNAIKFTDRGRVLVALDAVPDAASNSDDRRARRRLRWRVEDTGIGMDPAMIETLFEPFTQADPSDTRRHRGTGLGLSIVKRLLHLFDGEIHVRSEPGVGTRVDFSLPVEVIEPATQALGPMTPKRPRPTAKPSASLAILIADDERANRIIAERLLAKLGHRVSSVDNGRQVLDALAKDRFDLVLMDIQMPDLDGLETTRQIRAGQGGASPSNIPIVALTAHAFAEDHGRFIAAGMNDFLPKPIDFASLKAILAPYESS